MSGNRARWGEWKIISWGNWVWVFLISLGLVGGLPSEETLTGSYWLDSIGWIVWIVSAGSYRLDCIVLIISDGSYRLYRIGWIVLDVLYQLHRIGLGLASINWVLCADWFSAGWMVRMDCMGRWWYGGGMEGPTLAGTGTGAPPLALKGRHMVGIGGLHQLCWCCKSVEYLCRSSNIIKIDCTQIRTNT